MSTYELVKEFKGKYKGTITWLRLKKHADLVDKHLHPGEKVIYAFAGQNDLSHGSIFNTAVMALTNKRLILAQNRIFFGYKLTFVTPDLFNDLTVDSGIIWGTIIIDTIKEVIYFSNLSKKSLIEIQTKISHYMIKAKKDYMRKHGPIKR